MRTVALSILCALLGGCELYFGPGDDTGSDGSDGSDIPPDGGITPINTCGFFEGDGPVACTTPGASCEIETWEHGCSCSCGSDGWWSCFNETIGSHCPQPPPPDMGSDGVACGTIEAELTDHPAGWVISYGGDILHGGEALSAVAAGATVTIPFTGNGVHIYYEMGPNMGRYQVRVDDGPVAIVDALLPGDTFTFQNETIVATDLPYGEHVLSVTCLELECELDYVEQTCLAL